MVTKSEINNQIIVINNTFTNNILLKRLQKRHRLCTLWDVSFFTTLSPKGDLTAVRKRLGYFEKR